MGVVRFTDLPSLCGLYSLFAAIHHNSYDTGMTLQISIAVALSVVSLVWAQDAKSKIDSTWRRPRRLTISCGQSWPCNMAVSRARLGGLHHRMIEPPNPIQRGLKRPGSLILIYISMALRVPQERFLRLEGEGITWIGGRRGRESRHFPCA